MFEAWLQRWWWPLLSVGVALHVMQLFGALLEPDAALYATIARHMAESGDFVDLVAYQQDWLDKPHLPFWLTALAFKCFGIDEVAYRVPGVAVFFVGVAYTYRLGALLFDRTVGRLAVLVLLTSQHVVMSNADVRAEPYLLGFLAAAVFHSLRGRDSFPQLVLGALFTALAMMTKGPFVVVPVLGALLAFEWRRVVNWRAPAFAALTLLFITPELYCLWSQFDAHPEKVVFGRTGVSGLRFFFWDSQFGRFMNTGPIRGSGDPTFFFHTVLWAFLPWSLWLYGAVIARLRRRWSWSGGERHLLGAALSTMLVFSASRFQLPHYLNIVFPFFALLVAAWLVKARPGWLAVQSGHLAVVATLGFGVLLTLLNDTPGAAAALLLLGLGGFALFRRTTPESTFGRMFVASLALNVVLGFAWWPELLRYQVGREAARAVNASPASATALVGVESLSFAFHLRGPLTRYTVDDLRKFAPGQSTRALMNANDVPALRAMGFSVKELARYRHFHVSTLTLRFLDFTTRESATEPWVLVELRR